MSQKRVKRERRLLREMLKDLGPIVDSAMFELDDEPEMFGKWISAAFVVRSVAPEIPLEELLPNRLDETIAKIDKQHFFKDPSQHMEAALPKIEDTP